MNMIDTLLILVIANILIGIILGMYVLRKYFAKSSQYFGAKSITSNDKILLVIWLSISFALVVTTFVILFS